MDNRRFFPIFLLFAATWLFFAPRFFPGLFPKPKPKPPVQKVAEVADDETADSDGSAAATPAAPGEIAKHESRTIVLGPRADAAPDASYFLRVTTTSKGAAIESAELLNPRYTTLDRKAPLKVVGNSPAEAGAGGDVLRTLDTTVAAIEKQLKSQNLSLNEVDWEVVPGSESETGVTYRYRAPDGSLEVRKKYELRQGDPQNPSTDMLGYLLGVDLTIENLTDKPITTKYELTGPTGLPIDDPENARTYIELKAGTLEETTNQDDVTAVSLTASTVLKELEKAESDPAALTVWRKPLRYAGSDVQYFAALLVPKEDQILDANKDGRPDAYFSEARPILVQKTTLPEQSDVALQMTSIDLDIPAGKSVIHSFDLFLGPKRSVLLEPLGAQPIMNYGWWRVISNLLLSVLNFYHHYLHLPYWAAIIMLTVAVRALMFPISLKQTAGAQKMKEIQPELQELRKKFGKEPEKFAVAQRDLFRKHNYNPLSGCLPIFLQLPIFIGLYNALYYAVDLRLARFLWVDSLASPDALFNLPFRVPILGWTQFNLLPFVVVALFVMQQRMFMPPATTDEQRMQNKMMNFMTIAMGFLFYRSPAGLCIYFIASSLWGICERKILDRMKPQIEARAEAKRAKAQNKPQRESWFDKLVAAADQARKQTSNGRPGEAAKANEKSSRTKR